MTSDCLENQNTISVRHLEGPQCDLAKYPNGELQLCKLVGGRRLSSLWIEKLLSNEVSNVTKAFSLTRVGEDM